MGPPVGTRARDVGAMDRLSVLCFAGTYGLALASDLSRFAVRSAARWYLTVGLTALGWVVQAAYLGNLAWSSGQIPVTTVFESLLVLSWILAAIDLYLMVRSPRPVAVGMFVLPLVLALVVMAGLMTAPQQADWGAWGGVTAFWGSVHGVFLLAGAVSTCVAFLAGLMYLVQSHRLKRKTPFAVRVRAAQPGAVGAAEPGGDHPGLPAPDVRPADRRRAGPGLAEPQRDAAELDRPQGPERPGDVAGLRGAPARPVSPGDARAAGDAADGGGLRLPGLQLGRGRGLAVAHGAPRGAPGVGAGRGS